MGPILLLIAAGLAWGWWNAARAAAERATEVGRDACAAAGAIWLDHSVHARGWRPYRRADGWPGLERSFSFDYSLDGHDRNTGRLVLRQGRLVAFSGPQAAENVARFSRSGD